MAWPKIPPQTLDNLPLTGEGRLVLLELRTLHGDQLPALAQFVTSHAAVLEQITNGNAEKEELLGELIVTNFMMAGNVRERRLEGWAIPT